MPPGRFGLSAREGILARLNLRRVVSPLGGGMVAQFAWAVPLAILLWVAAAWAMGWLP